ncbi:MAG: hypothetical protein M3217_08200 [Actinomycetota bacterium]|nr:hypothetical protein [Actinomycetota bacterium]
MARTGKWPARISLALSVAMIAGLFSVISASGQQSSTAGLTTIGVDVESASITQATYSFVVRNQGTAPSTNVRVRSTVPATMTFESSDPDPTATTSPSPGAASCADAGIRETEGTVCEWSLGTLNPGDTRTITAIYNLPQTNIATRRFEMTATASDGEGRNNTDTDDSLVRQRATPNDDTWVDDGEPPGTNHGACNFLRVLQGNTVTSFIDVDTLGTPPTSQQSTQSIEAVHGAQLRLEVLDTTYSQGAPGTIGAHRITTGEWIQGSGTCQGSVPSSPTTEPRTGAEPSSAASPTGTTEVSAAAQVVNLDVTGDLDTEGERGSFQGWELRDQTAGNTNATRFHSTEAGDAEDPQLFWVYTTIESPTCIDSDPDDATRAVGTEHLMAAFVTDGNKTPTGNTPGAGTGPGGDACNGAPVAAPVEWVIEDDTPDIYFSSQEGSPIQKVVSGNNAGPNSIVTTADDNGLTGAGVRLDVTPGSDASNRIEARIQGATGDPDPASPSPQEGTCAQVTVPQGKNCSGESHQFDDMTVTWAAQSGTTSSPGTTTSTTGSTSPSGTASTSPSGTASTSPSGTASTSPSSASPSRSATTTGGTTSGTTSSPAQSSRTVSLFASSNEVVYPAQVTLSGQIISPDQSCEDAGEFVRIQRRLLGESQFTDFESDNTDADGRYEVSFQATESAEYVAVAPRHDQCSDASSEAESVLVKVKVTGRAGRRSVPRGSNVGIVGRVQPDHDGTTVVLQRRKGGRFVAVARDELNVRSRYRFVVTANWKGRRVFRVVWKKQDDNHEANTSRNIVIRSTRP